MVVFNLNKCIEFPRMAVNHWVPVLLVLVSSPALVSGFFVIFKSSNQTKAFQIPFVNLDVDTSAMLFPPLGIGTNLSYFRNLSAKFTADERCETGKPLGIAVYQYQPYLSMLPYPFGRYPIIGVELFDIFPILLKKALEKCCHPNSTVDFAELLTSQSVNASLEVKYDMYLPLHGDNMDDTTYQDNAFIPILQAPSVALLVFSHDSKKGNTKLIITTIFKNFPLLIFIFLTASTSGIVIWFLDHKQNQDEFSNSFIKGAWEGFWWAFITMTTVGYGDRTPRSVLGRLFCFIWIIFGIITFSIFSGLITASLYASTQQQFEIRGAKIGAVGTEEFKLGLNLNANMKVYRSTSTAFTKLLAKEVAGILVDSYAATYFGEQIARLKVRRDRMIDHPITYGIMLGKNTSNMEKCIRKYFSDNPQEVFEIVRKSLHPEKNEADSENLQLKEATKLFHQDSTFKRIIEIEAIVLCVLLFLGTSYQLSVYLWKKWGFGEQREGDVTHHLVKDSKWRLGSFKRVDGPIDDLIEQYKCFENGWANRLKSL